MEKQLGKREEEYKDFIPMNGWSSTKAALEPWLPFLIPFQLDFKGSVCRT